MSIKNVVEHYRLNAEILRETSDNKNYAWIWDRAADILEKNLPPEESPGTTYQSV